MPKPKKADKPGDFDPPVDIIVRFWREAEPEIFCTGLAPWLVAVTLAEATQLIIDQQNAEASDEAEKET